MAVTNVLAARAMLHTNFRDALLIAGKVPVAVTYEPYISNATSHGSRGAHVLFSSKNAPGLISDFLVTTQGWLGSHAAEAKALMVSMVHGRSAKVAPVTTMDSPSAMMIKPAQRSAMWPPSTTQSATADAPYFGIQNRTAGEMYSIVSATAQNTSREYPSAKPPAR